MMAKIKEGRVRASSLSANAAKAAFEAVRPRLEQLTTDELIPIRIDVQAAAAVAHSVGVRDAAPERHQRFEQLARGGNLDLTVIDSLPEVALAAWHARQQQQLQSALASKAAIPAATVVEAQAVRKRMLLVLEYYFQDDAAIAAKLGVIRAGTGHQDLANDLQMLADLYQEPGIADWIVRDVKHFRAEDAAQARTLATTIFNGLGLSPADKALDDAAQRAWTLLDRVYERVRRAGQYLFVDDENVDVTYPSLISSVRSPATKADEPAPPAPVTPSS